MRRPSDLRSRTSSAREAASISAAASSSTPALTTCSTRPRTLLGFPLALSQGSYNPAGDPTSAAQNQVGDYYLGMNGLADHGPDDGPKVVPIKTWEEYQRS